MKKYTSNTITAHGTKEWADTTVNCCNGCVHNCRYCYAKSMALRFKRTTNDEWGTCVVRQHDVAKKHPKYQGRVMFPSSHDITPDNYDACSQVLRNLLEAGNQVLVVSKPHLDVIDAICHDFVQYRNQITFRFTIGALDDVILRIWEPDAPSYLERKDSLQLAYQAGFETSVSIEPMLDPSHIDALVAELNPFVTETIWIGKLNYLGRIIIDCAEIELALNRLQKAQSDLNIMKIYARLNGHPKIEWKDSIKKVVLAAAA